MSKQIIGLILLLMIILVGCRQAEPLSSDDINIEIAFESLTLGENGVIVTLKDNDGNAINDATVNVRGDMSHAGMVPVIVEIESGVDGVYSGDYEWTMAGDWEVGVTVTLPDGTTVGETAGFTVAGEMDDMEDMSEMGTEEPAMDHDTSAMSGAVTAGYLQITNNGDSDITLVGVSAEGIGIIEIHETTVDENDMASMQPLPDGLLIPAGETVMLAPVGYHLMMMNIEANLMAGETLTLTLTFDNDETVEVPAMIQMLEPDESETVESGDITVTGAWVRPTIMMGDMEETEEPSGD